MKYLSFACAALLASLSLVNADPVDQHYDGWKGEPEKPMTFTADAVAVDNVTKAALATGHVHAVRSPITLLSERLERDEEGVMHFYDPTCATTCTNDIHHTHWDITGEFTYKDNDYVIVQDAWIRLFEIPLIYIPYLYYPLGWSGIQWMPGYMGQWGGFIMTKTSYDIVGDAEHRDNTWWLRGETALDWRYKQGIAAGQDLFWNLGDFGQGRFGLYYAWDDNAEKQYGGDNFYKDANFGSPVERERYGLSIHHRWQVTERDVFFLRGTHYSDSYFLEDFMRKSFFEIKTQWLSFQNSGFFWEHLENSWSIGAEVSGRLNEFYGLTQRLPEVYFDLNPTPLGDTPLNYETQNHIGWLERHYAKYAGASVSAFGVNPGLWCDYSTLRFDTYHRVTMPFRTADDVLSVVPRIGFHGTYWKDSGLTDLYGMSGPVDAKSMFRSIGEVGVTFAARGKGWVDDEWSHMIEPYCDVLLQEAWYTGKSDDNRPYVFDAVDASQGWEDQFAGRGRNLPYSYYGLTPGLRNAWSCLEESGYLREVLDFDVYAAVMFDAAKFDGIEDYGDYDQHKLAELGKRNYGRHDANLMPGARLRWKPNDDISLRAIAEYDSDNNKLALGSISLDHRLTKEFRWDVAYSLRNYRYWDFSSIPYAGQTDDTINMLECHFVRVGFEYQPLDWLAMGPFCRFDCKAEEYDAVGAWIDFMTDCLGFRLLLEHDNEFERIDGYKRAENTSIGFYIYMRSLGNSHDGIFSAN